MIQRAGTANVIKRSFDIYYRDADRTKRMDQLNAMFVRPGDLAFDIGAHVGDRTASYRRLGARVVTVEPQPQVFRALRLLFGRDPQVHLLCTAIGAVEGRTAFFVNSANPTTSTAARDLVNAAPDASAWADQEWDQVIETPVQTLDKLIATHGQPDFVKVDVEGHEAEVFLGLSQPVATVVFEFTTLQPQVAITALQRLMELGPYRFNYSLGETHTLLLPNRVSVSEMAEILRGLPMDANSGDIYATLGGDR